MPFGLFGSGSKIRQGVAKRLCFFCNQYCSAGLTFRPAIRGYEWKCENCEALNVIDENGEIMDYVPEQIPGESVVFTRRSPSSNNSFSANQPFCSQCLLNHRIVAEAMANFLPSESDPRYEDYARRAPAYKAELETRYPPYCDACHQKVVDQIKENNYKARSLVLGDMLKKRRRQPRSVSTSSVDLRNAAIFGEGEVLGDGKVLKFRWTTAKRIKVLVWMTRGALLFTHILFFSIVFASNIAYPSILLRELAKVHDAEYDIFTLETARSITQTIISLYRYIENDHSVDTSTSPDELVTTLAIRLFAIASKTIPIGVLYFFWNYKYFSALRSPVRVRLVGVKDCYILQACQFLLLLEYWAATYLLPRLHDWNVGERAFVLLSVFFLWTTLLISTFGFTMVKIVPVKSVVEIASESRSVSPSSSVSSNPTESSRPSSRIGQRQLTVQPASRRNIPEYSFPPRASKQNQYGELVGFSKDIEGEMDWRPTITGNSVTTTNNWMSESAPGLPSIPQLPPGSSLPPPPNGARSAFMPFGDSSNQNLRLQEQQKQQRDVSAFLRNRSPLPNSLLSSTNDSTSTTLAPQRFFPLEDPTGLEDIFAPALKLSDEPLSASSQRRRVSPRHNVFGNVIEETDNETASVQQRWSKYLGEFVVWIAKSAAVWAFLAVGIYCYKKYVRPPLDQVVIAA
ncbi:Ima1 N-terminal domain-containing protein [Myxozyma melibiosi]|uniref:Ima1 N-terminal domain-containing protein n=1 Tax=Myxozyma melibiosi TaxID=54550 RepID=A0ABR1FBE5_9ASCO